MKFINKIGVVLVLCTCFGALKGQDLTEADFMSQIQNNKNKTESIVCQFEQILEMSVLAEKQKSSGNFYYRNPGQLKWEQTNPDIYTLVINGDQSYKMEGDQRKELAAGGMQVVGFKRFILGTLDGSIFNSDQFNSTFTKEESWQIEMIPQKKALSKRFEKIQLTFDQQLLLQQLVFLEPGGDMRTIRFFNHQTNTLTDDSNFQ